MTQYRTKPVFVDAVQFLAAAELASKIDGVNFGEPTEEGAEPGPLAGKHWIQTSMGQTIVEETDWILTAEDGDRAVITDENFQRLYEPATVSAQEAPAADAGDHLSRMRTEVGDLDNKLGKLRAFVQDPDKFAKLPHAQQELLLEQHQHMAAYLVVLQKRLGEPVSE